MLGRWILSAFCIADAALLLLCGWLLPSHLCAVDVAVIQRAGESQDSSSLAGHGLALVRDGRVDAARLLLQVVRGNHLPGADRLSQAVASPAAQAPVTNQIAHLLNNGLDAAGATNGYSQPVTDSVIRLENRDRVLAFLQAAPSSSMRELMRCRDLTNTVLFSPSSSPSGQAFDAALSVCGLLLEEDDLAAGMREALVQRAAAANRGGDSEPLEQLLLDMMSLGQRLNWEQLAVFVHRMEDPQTLDWLTVEMRNAGATNLPLLFAAVELSQRPGAVAAYLGQFSQTGLADLGTSMNFGSGAMDELFARNERIYRSDLRERVVAAAPVVSFFRAATNYALRLPRIAVTVKWFLYFLGGFLIAVARRVVWIEPVNGEPTRSRGFRALCDMVFALGFCVVVLLLSEPFLAQASQKAEFPLRLRLPGVAGAAAMALSGAKTKLMNKASLLILLLFFVLQALLYFVSLAKLAEIRRQQVPAPLRLKLLENEEHLFDAGLYLGFCGTIVALILAIMGVTQFSLMSGYSSTAFGIIFVFIFKIFHLRPYRHELLME
jgi:hypothetical protein